MATLLDIVAYKLGRDKVLEQQRGDDIKRDLKEYENALEIIDILSPRFRIRLAKYLMTNYVKFSDLHKKDDPL
jgi:hypothetical protein